jgi:hypothetical protein
LGRFAPGAIHARADVEYQLATFRFVEYSISHWMAFSLHIRRQSLTRLIFFGFFILTFRFFFSASTPTHEIRAHNVLERVTRKDKTLDVQRHAFLQVRIGRDERDDFMKRTIMDGVRDYWERFQRPLWVFVRLPPPSTTLIILQHRV